MHSKIVDYIVCLSFLAENVVFITCKANLDITDSPLAYGVEEEVLATRAVEVVVISISSNMMND